MADEYELKNYSREISRYIPDDVLVQEILVRLPVKLLTAYKSVCKTWLYTIESRFFIEAHRCHHSCEYSDLVVFTKFTSESDPVTKSSSLSPWPPCFTLNLFRMAYIPLEDLRLPPEMTRFNWPDLQLEESDLAYWRVELRVLGPIKTTSIYCIVSYLHQGSLECHDFLGAKIAICNLATREYKLASALPPEEIPRLLQLAGREFFRAHYGFGVAADGDYKVVVVMICPPAFGNFLSYVYSLKQRVWTKIVDSENGMVSKLDLRDKQGFPHIYDTRLELCPQVFLNGCWHWIAVLEDGTRNLLSFDVDNEAFKLVWGPTSYRGPLEQTCSMVSVLNDHLVLLHHFYQSIPNVLSVWMMMEYGNEESWINIWTINFRSLSIETLVGISYSLRDDSNAGVQIHKIWIQIHGRKLVCCDEVGEIMQQHFCYTDSCICWNILGISAYNETLERLSPSKHGTAAA